MIVIYSVLGKRSHFGSTYCKIHLENVTFVHCSFPLLNHQFERQNSGEKPIDPKSQAPTPASDFGSSPPSQLSQQFPSVPLKNPLSCVQPQFLNDAAISKSH